MAIRYSQHTGLLDIGSYRGAPVYLSPAFFLTAALLASPFWHAYNMRGLLLAAIFVVVVFVSILVHELAHAEIARSYGMGAERIDINMSGGLVYLRGSPPTMAQEFAITAAGPLANLALAIVAVTVWKLIPTPVPDMIVIGKELVPGFVRPGIAERALRATAYLNFGLCAVNLLPGLPLDGGKLAYLLTEQRWDSRFALLVVSSLGLFFACVTSFLLVVTALAGVPVWAPPEFKVNWRAFQAARAGRGGWDNYAFA